MKSSAFGPPQRFEASCVNLRGFLPIMLEPFLINIAPLKFSTEILKIRFLFFYIVLALTVPERAPGL